MSTSKTLNQLSAPVGITTCQEMRGGWMDGSTTVTISRPFYFPEAPNVTEATKAGPQVFNWEGSVLSASSSIFWALLAVTVKLSPSTAMAKLLFHLSVGVFVGIMTCMAGVRLPYGPLSAQPALFFRSILVVSAFFARLFALRYLSLVDAFVLSSLSPALYLCPHCFSCGRRSNMCLKIMAIGMTIGAVATILLANLIYGRTRAQSTPLFVVGVILAVTSSVLRAIVRTFSEVTRTIPKAVLIFHWSLLALFTSCGMAVSLDRPWQLFDEHDIGVMVFLAKMSFASVYFLDKAREIETYGMTNIFLYVMDLLISCAMARFLLKEETGPLSYVAAALVATSVVVAEVYVLKEKIGMEADVWEQAF